MKRGFTIVELLIYMVIMGTMFTVLGGILLSTLDVQMESESVSTIEADGRFLLARLGYDVHRASSLTTPNLVLTINGQTYTYSVANSIFQLTTPSGSSHLTSPGVQVSNFSVTQLGNPTGVPTAQIKFTLTNGHETRNYQTTVGLRH